MTFFGNNCKIAVAFFVNAFANFYLSRIEPFHLPLNQRLLSLPFLNRNHRGMNSMNELGLDVVLGAWGITSA
jgi:hypothetical protein